MPNFKMKGKNDAASGCAKQGMSPSFCAEMDAAVSSFQRAFKDSFRMSYMGRKTKDLASDLKLGDLIHADGKTGNLIAISPEPASGLSLLTIVGSQGELWAIYSDQVEEHFRALRMIDTAEWLFAAVQPGKVSDALAVGPMADERCAVIQWLSELATLVAANGKRNSNVVRAFAVFSEQWDSKDGPKWGAVHMAAQAWRGLDDAGRRKILNGSRHAGLTGDELLSFQHQDHAVDRHHLRFVRLAAEHHSQGMQDIGLSHLVLLSRVGFHCYCDCLFEHDHDLQ